MGELLKCLQIRLHFWLFLSKTWLKWKQLPKDDKVPLLKSLNYQLNENETNKITGIPFGMQKFQTRFMDLNC